MGEVDGTLTRDAKAQNPFATSSLLMEAHSELLQREPDLQDKSDYLSKVQEFFDRAQATGAVLDDEDERRTAQSILNYWITVLYRANVGKPDDTTLAEYDARAILEMGDAQCPYPGVRAFREDENRLFFGRQRQINYMLGRLREDRLLAVVGPSGSGKTSLVLAGLLPEMKQNDKVNKIERYFFPVFTPGSHPLENLESMFQPSGDGPADENSPKQKTDFHQDSFRLLKRIEHFQKLPVVIVVDQFEEVFTRANEKDRHSFIANLARVIQAPHAKHIVILTMRDDNYDSYLRRPERFRKALDPAKVSLPQLGSMELREAIEKPGAYVGLKFDEATTETLVKEIISEPVGLPPLQFTLWKLWARYKQKEDINEAFKEMGTSRALLSTSAEEFFSKLDFRDQRLCRRLLTELITLDSDSKASSYPVARSELYRRIEKHLRVDSLVDKLAEEQLVRLSLGAVRGDDEVELVHDSLIHSWPRMAEWVSSKKNVRRWRRIAAGVLLAALIFLLALLGALVWGGKKQGDKSRELARLSNKQFTNDRLDLALLFGLAAYTAEPNGTTEGNMFKLLYALQSTSHPKMFLYERNFEAEDMAFSAERDGDPIKLAAVDNEGNILIWNLISRTIEKRLMWKMATYPLAFSPDGKTLATASLDPAVTLILWNLENDQPRKLTQESKAFPITSLAFSPDSRTLVTGSDNGSVIQWDDLTSNGIKTTTLYHHSDTVTSIVFQTSGKLVASGSADRTAAVWDNTVKGGNRRNFGVRGEFKGPGTDAEKKRIVSLAFKNQEDPLENQLAAGSDDEAFLWDLDGGKQVTEFSSGPNPAGILVSFTDEGELLAAFSYDGALILWDSNAEQVVGKQFYKSGATHSAAFSNNGRLLALPGDDGVVVWDVVSPRIPKAGSTVPVGSLVKSIAFSPNPNNQIMASRGGDGSLTVWKIPSTEQQQDIGSQITVERRISSLAFSENGEVLALGLDGGIISLRDSKNYKQTKALDAQTGKLVKEVSLEAGQEPEAAVPDSEPQAPQVVSKVVFDPNPGTSRLAAVVKPRKTELAKTDNDDDLGTRIILWNTNDPTSNDAPIEQNTVVTSLAFSPDGQILAWGSADKRHGTSDNKLKDNFKVVLWNGKEQEALPCSLKDLCEDRVASLAFDRQRQILAAGLDNGKILLWDLTTRKKIGDNPMEGSAGRVTDLAFGLDGTILAAVTNKKLRHPQPGVITLWDVETREPIGNPLRGHDGIVSAIAFSADGKMLASGSDSEVEHNIILWDLDIKHAGQRFCEIVDCRHSRPEVEEKVKKTSLFQWLYGKVFG